MTNKPKKWKMILLTWICIYPLINILFFVLMPYMIDKIFPTQERC